MSSVNRVIILGNLGADPELQYTGANRAVCNLSVATNEVFKDKAGQRQERTEWHRVVCWGDIAENASKYLKKGRQVYLEGRLRTSSWEDKEGNKRYRTDIVADRVVFLAGGGGSDRRDDNERSGPPPASGDRRSGQHREERYDGPPPAGGERGRPLPGDEDIPF